MDTRQTHFEIFVKKNRKADWAMNQVVTDRDDAVKKAKALFEQYSDSGSVRVDKEIFDPDTGGFQAVTVLALGEAESGLGAAKKDAEPPCSLPEDLLTVHARRVIARVLADWLARKHATPIELVHRADLAEALDMADTTLQHAIQKTAIAQASEFEANVQHFVKRLNDLTERAIADLLEKEAKGKLPRIGDAGFADLADRLGEKALYRLRAAVAHELKPASSWEQKVDILLRLAESADTAQTRETALGVVDEFLAEILAIPEAAAALAGEAEDVGDRLDALVDVIGGKVDDLDGAAARALAGRFARKELRSARTALIQYVLNELRRPQRLKPGAFWDEVRLSRTLADHMIAMAGRDLPPEDIGEAFVYRAGRLVQPEAIDEALEGAEDAGEELARLIRLEEALAGPVAKKKLASYMRAHLSSHRVEAALTGGAGKPLERARRIGGLQKALLDANFPKEEREELAAALDRMCMAVLTEARLFDAFARGSGAPLDRAAALLKLAAHGGVTRGRASAEACARAQALLRQGLTGEAPDAAKLTTIKTLLGELAA